MLQAKTFTPPRDSNQQGALSPWKSKPRPKVRWSHQTELVGLKGREVALSLRDELQGNRGLVGVLVEADQYTIKLSRDGQTEVFFKSALISYREAA